MTELRKLTENIAWLPATEDPLSADVGIVQSGDRLWIYDVGASREAAETINALPGRKTVVLSHFHADHAGNIGRAAWDELYAGPFTCKRLGVGTEVREDMIFEGVRLFPLPSSHAKGCVGLAVGEYAFVGDGIYSAAIDGKPAYNAGLLQSLIKTLKNLEARWLLLSHGEPFARDREEVMAELEEIYARRDKDSPYIYL